MALKKITKTTAANGDISYTEDSVTILQAVASPLTSIAGFSGETTFHSNAVVAIATLGGALGGLIVGASRPELSPIRF